mmetsp:Transcript_2966/g.9258  ORF Transcript_2966/g.9258 Transcript_2966/m.9258 type:complete len:293 (-) Transcript_2966:254-1132(-)|eukprot:CAMPEP_0177642680 /NCGR_PEP_ID=MMETSP0447-20121125/7729_1 /TAXON_ID=0 /ORGANISM="Stygamoeba regulata, Strain BSH-02190019" /LENGTH=292 /DNA_ID=CAMNT_0019144881 /DNA_START=193 /DNA_END=1071 /DNA_ORIENTATION=+
MGSAASASAKVRKLSEKGDEAGLEKLLRKVKGGVGPDVIDGVDPNHEDGATALALAAKHGHLGVVKKLLTHNANPMIPDSDGETALSHAAENGNLDVLKELLTADNVDVNGGDETNPPLISAARQGHIDCVNYLLKSGANPSKENSTGETALIHAIVARKAEVVQLLLDAGADPELGCILPHAKTPLIAATSRLYQNINIVVLLLKSGANPNQADKDGNTALHTAVRDQSVSLVNLLMDAGADPNLKASNGKSPIDVANDTYTERNVIHARLAGEKIDMKEEDQVWSKVNKQ